MVNKRNTIKVVRMLEESLKTMKRLDLFSDDETSFVQQRINKLKEEMEKVK